MRGAEEVTFAGSALDRAAHLRGDAAALGARADARCLMVWRGKPLCRAAAQSGTALAWVPLDAPLLQASGGPAVFLGLAEGAPRFAADVSAWEDPEADAGELGRFVDRSQNRHPSFAADEAFLELRGVMARLAPGDAGIAATARGILGWHQAHRFGANCGAPSVVDEGGWRRSCPACKALHFPRTDPVVIMLITWGNAVLLGRSPSWPAGMYSLLAGFMEPGETIEAAVRRETFEEAGVRVGPVAYLASQPWPFPSSLMIGCHGAALGPDLRRDPAELEDARWVTREGVLAALGGHDPEMLPARPGAIARFLLERWLADRLE